MAKIKLPQVPSKPNNAPKSDLLLYLVTKPASAVPTVQPNAFISSWYNALSVKPSETLLTDLNTLTAGMDADGDWTELDFFALSAGMETEEQALRPLKTTGSATMTNYNNGGGGLQWSPNGFASNGTDVLRSGYNTLTNSIKYTLNSASFYFYGNTRSASFGARQIFGSDYSPDGILDYLTQASLQRGASSMSIANAYIPNSEIVSATTATASKTGLTIGNANIPFYCGIKRTASNQGIAFINGVNSSNNNSPSTILADCELILIGTVQLFFPDPPTYIGGTSIYGRAGLIGSGSVSQTNTGSRLNTFFTARGLNPYV